MDSFERLHTENIRAVAKDAILLLPVGGVEQHGPHLPLTVDTEIPIRIGALLAEKINLILAPAVAYGARSLPQSGGGHCFPGTINVRGSVLTEYLKDVIAGYIATGFRSMVILNGHYENESFIFEAIELCREEGRLEGAKIIATGWWSLVPDALLDKLFGGKFPGWHTEHASVCETSLMLHFRGDLVGPTRVDNATPQRSGIYLYPAEPSKFSNRGVLGSSSPATAEIGRALCDEICSQLISLIREHMRTGTKRRKRNSRKQ
jgi:creatinine amidohydrolase